MRKSEILKTIRELGELNKDGLLSDEEYNREKDILLSQLRDTSSSSKESIPQVETFYEEEQEVQTTPKKKKRKTHFITKFIASILLLGALWYGYVLLYAPEAYRRSVLRSSLGLAVPVAKFVGKECEAKNVKRKFYIGSPKSATVKTSVDVKNEGRSGHITITFRVNGRAKQKRVWIKSAEVKRVTEYIKIRFRGSTKYRCSWFSSIDS